MRAPRCLNCGHIDRHTYGYGRRDECRQCECRNYRPDGYDPLSRVYSFILHYVLIATPLLLLTGLIAIWIPFGWLSSRIGNTCGVFGVLDGVAAMTLFIWSIDGAPEPLPSRKVRRGLKKEQDRIALEAAIKEAEREAGLR